MFHVWDKREILDSEIEGKHLSVLLLTFFTNRIIQANLLSLFLISEAYGCGKIE